MCAITHLTIATLMGLKVEVRLTGINHRLYFKVEVAIHLNQTVRPAVSKEHIISTINN